MALRHYEIDELTFKFIDANITRTLNLCSSPKSLTECTPDDDATASYAGAFGYSYQTLKMIKTQLDAARLVDPSVD